MKIVDRLGDLSRAEMGRIRTTLKRRYRLKDRGGVLEVGFGMAERDDRVDPRRREAICFYVGHKRMPRRKQQRIPAQVEVRVRREAHFVLVRLPADVLEVDATSLTPSGRTVRAGGASARRATVGCVLAWRLPEARRLEWGLLTVGHLFDRMVRGAGQEPPVRIVVGRNRELAGTLLVRADRTSQVDAAIVRVAKSTLVRAGLISNQVSTRGKRIRPPRQLMHDAGRAGLTLPGRGRIPFVVLRYLPLAGLIPALGMLTDVLDVSSPQTEAFAPGRSGSLWLIERQAACQQFGGWETPGRPAKSYRRGLGQALTPILTWAREMLALTAGMEAGQVDIRLIREL